MNTIAYMALLGWPCATVMLFLLLPPRRAALIALIGGWLILPMGAIALRGLPEYTKQVAVCLPIVLCTFAFAPHTFARLRLRLFDVPIIVWCLSPLTASLANGLGWYDGLAGTSEAFANWGLAYLVGRLHFASPRGLRTLALGIICGALVYVPVCVWEMRMAPTLHSDLYGFMTFRFATTMRFGGYRPVGFFQHGISLGLFMTTAALLAGWLYARRGLPRVDWLPWGIVAPGLILMALLCRSLGALAIGLAVGGLLTLSYMLRHRWPLALGVATPLLYIALALGNALPRDTLVSMAEKISAPRAESLAGRLHHEQLLVERGCERPLFGWGGWGRNRITSDDGEDVSVTDGLWIIAFGQYGLIGLLSIFGCYLLPALFLLRWRTGWLYEPATAAVTGLALVLVCRAVDALLNGMPNPIFLVASGGLLPTIVTVYETRAARGARASRGAGVRTAGPRWADSYCRSSRTAEFVRSSGND